MCIVYALTAYHGGGSFWQQSMLETVGMKQGILPDFLYNLAWNEWFMAYGGLMLVFNTVLRYVLERRTSPKSR